MCRPLPRPTQPTVQLLLQDMLGGYLSRNYTTLYTNDYPVWLVRRTRFQPSPRSYDTVRTPRQNERHAAEQDPVQHVQLMQGIRIARRDATLLTPKAASLRAGRHGRDVPAANASADTAQPDRVLQVGRHCRSQPQASRASGADLWLASLACARLGQPVPRLSLRFSGRSS
jgi:hypothetical protein